MTNGMKPGSGTDPFEDMDNEDDAEETTATDTTPDTRTDSVEQTATKADSSSASATTSSALPFIYARDGVKQARSHTFQLHYLSETYQQEKHVQSELEDRLGEDIYKVDLREAMVQAAFENLGDVEDVLREWGYDAD